MYTMFEKIHQDNASLFLLIILLTYGWMGQECNKKATNVASRNRLVVASLASPSFLHQQL
jgi:hypothetical protein